MPLLPTMRDRASCRHWANAGKQTYPNDGRLLPASDQLRAQLAVEKVSIPRRNAGR